MATDAAKDKVDRLIRTHKVVIFHRQGCPLCLGARNTIRKCIGSKKLLTSSDVVFFDIEEADDTRETLNYLKLITGKQSVPNVFIHGQFIGGHDKLKFLQKTGELEELLKKGPVLKK